MRQTFTAVPVCENVYWVGAIDWAVRDFHGYWTASGTTYNAYLVVDDKVTLIDTVREGFADEMMARIASVLPVSEIDYVVSNHAELDHSGALPALLATARPEKVFTSNAGVRTLAQHFTLDTEVVGVADGHRLCTGKYNLEFIHAAMLHWPESMFTYLEEHGVLFSQDAFGMHLASSERFADEIADAPLRYEATKYFANILAPYSKLVNKTIAKLEKSKPGLSIIAPDHGPVWRQTPEQIVEFYARLAEGQPLSKKAVIVYDTMWKSTEKMAHAIAQGLFDSGIHYKMMPLKVWHRSDVVTELHDASGLLLGTPTLNNNLFPTIADLLTYLRGLKPVNKVTGVFGSHGWSGEGVTQAADMLLEMGLEVVGSVKSRYVPGTDVLEQCRQLGAKVAARLAE